MRLALNGATLGPCPLDEELEAASASGFRLLELRAPKLVGVSDLASRLKRHQLEAWTINSLEGAGERDLGEEARRQAAAAAGCGCPYVVCVPGRRREGLGDALVRLADVCRAEGAALAFEFMGFEWSAVRSLRAALTVYDGPLVIDTFHWSLGDRQLEDLRACDPSRIAVVHVNDAPSRSLAHLGDADRVLPGEGVLELGDFYTTLGKIAYDGVYSVELFNPRLWEDGPGPAARSAYRAMSRLFTPRSAATS